MTSIQSKRVSKRKPHEKSRMRKTVRRDIVFKYNIENKHISFNSQKDKDNGFFELIHNGSSGFSGIGKNEFIVTGDQIQLLKDKHINFTEIHRQ